jgi:hypothetical protein
VDEDFQKAVNELEQIEDQARTAGKPKKPRRGKK